MPRLQTFAQDGRLISTVDTRSPAEARAGKLAGLDARLRTRVAQLFPLDAAGDDVPTRTDVLTLVAAVLAAPAALRKTLADLRDAAEAHRAAISGLKTVADLDAYDLDSGWPA